MITRKINKHFYNKFAETVSSKCFHMKTGADNRYHLKTATESSLRNVVFYIKDRTMDNVQNFDSYFNILLLSSYIQGKVSRLNK
jgi:hypothetical protein